MTPLYAVNLQKHVNAGTFKQQKNVKVIETADMFAVVYLGESENVVVIRGTDKPSDWWNINAKIGQEEWNGIPGTAHKGFKWASFQLIFDLTRALDLAKPTTFIGHSMGGAVAQLLASAFVSTSYEVNQVITFGSPRVGNKVWSKWYDKVLGDITQRYVNTQDLVPRLPWLLGSYRHTNTQIVLDPRPWWKRMWHVVTLRSLTNILPKLIKIKKSDHAILSYVTNVRRKFA